MYRQLILATLLAGAFGQPASAARTKKPLDQTDSVKALVRPGSATRKVETANRATAEAFWQAICWGTAGQDETQYLAPGFISHSAGMGTGQTFVDALRTREQGWKLAQSKAPLFAMSTGELVMISEGADAKNPQASFHVSVLRIVDGKISEYWADGI